MKTYRLLLWTLLLVTGIADVAQGQAGTQLISAKKLLIKNAAGSNKIVFVSKHPSAIVPLFGSPGDPTTSGTGGGGGSLRVVGTDDLTIPLPAANWTQVPGNHGGYNYEDSSGATCSRIKIRGGLVKAICKGTGANYTLGSAETTVNVVLRTGTGPNDYCATFSGAFEHDGSDGKKYLGKDAPAGTCSP